MRSTRRGWLAILGWAAVTAAGWAQAPARPESAEPRPAPRGEMGPPAAGPRTLEDLNVPPNTVIVICDDPQKAMNMVPRAIVLTPQRYQELLRVEREAGQRPQTPLRLTVPASCKLTCRVDGDIARVRAQFQIVTDRPRTLVALGCQRGWVRAATLDGQLPLFVTDPARDEGLIVQVEKPGRQTLSLDLALPIVSRGPKGQERGFDLGLPRSAITNLDLLEVGGELAELKINGRILRPQPDRSTSRVENEALGAAEHLEVVWKGRTPAGANVAPTYAADGRIVVRVEEKRVVTDVELQLQVLAGDVAEFRIRLPAGLTCELREPGPQDDRFQSLELPRGDHPWLVLHLKRPTTEPVRVAFQVHQPLAGTRVGIGPFSVAGALRQTGTITVSAAPDFRLGFEPHGDMMPRDLADDASRGSQAASFTYWNVPAPGAADAPRPQLLVDVQPVQGALESRVEHTLELTLAGWRVNSRIDFSPLRRGVDTVEVQVPDDYPFDATRGVMPAELADAPTFDAKRRVATIKLTQKQLRPFSLTLPALYPVPAGAQRAALELPRPLNTLDRGAKTVVVLPGDLDLTTRPGEAESASPSPGRSRRYTQSWEHAPERLDLAWRPHRPNLDAESLLDVTVRPTLVSVQQRIDLQFHDRTTEQVALQVPAVLADRVRILQGGAIGEQNQVKLDRAGARATLVLAYDLPVTDERTRKSENQLLTLPLVRVPAATHVQTKARLWCDTSQQLATAEPGWDELPVETVADRDALPVLVLRATTPQAMLTVRRAENPVAAARAVVVERGLVQVVAAEDGRYNYRARIRLARVAARQLDLGFPGPVAGLNLSVFVDGKRLNGLRVVDTAGNAADNGTVARLALEPELYRGPIVLEARYQLGGNRRRGGGAWLNTFFPPSLPREAAVGPVRWQFNLAADSVFLYRDDSLPAEQAWAWRGVLLMPSPAGDAAELEQWLTGSAGESTPQSPGASVVGWRADLEPFQLVQLPQAAWLLACSAVVLGVGLALLFAPLPRPVVFAALLLLSLALAYASVAWPSALPVVLYGCEPGLAVLAATLLIQAAGRAFQSRRTFYLPAFTRVRVGAALGNPGSSHRQRREPTTVDAPVPLGSSVTRKHPGEGS